MWSRLTVVVRQLSHPQVRFRLLVLLRPICFSQIWSWAMDELGCSMVRKKAELTKRFSAVVHRSRQCSHLHRRESSALLVGGCVVVVLAGAGVSAGRAVAVSCCWRR